jgi:hypothetical protein
LTCLLIIACVVVDLFAKKNPCISRSQTFTTETKLSLKKCMRGVPHRTTVTKLRKQILIFQSWHAKLSQCQNWGVFFAEWTRRTSKNHDILVCFFPRSLEWPQLALQILAAQATQRLRRCHLYRIGPHDLFLNDACTCCSK